MVEDVEQIDPPLQIHLLGDAELTPDIKIQLRERKSPEVSLVQFTASNHLAEFHFFNHLFSEHWNPVLNLEHLNLAMAQFAAESDECLPLLRGHNFRHT